MSGRNTRCTCHVGETIAILALRIVRNMDIPLVKHMNRGKNTRQFTKNTISIIVKQKSLGLVYGA